MIKILLNLFCGLLFCWNFAFAQVPGNFKLKASGVTTLQVDKSPTKLSPELKKIAARNSGPEIQSLSLQAKPVLANDGLDKYIQYRGDGVVIDVSVKGSVKSAKEDLQKNGFQVSGVYGRVISGIIPLVSLGKLETLESIQYAKPAFNPIRPFKSAGSLGNGKKSGSKITPVISQGDIAQRSDIARKKYNVKGVGVKVGIISDSYDNLGTAKKGVKQGELPGPGNPFHFNKPVEVLEDLDNGGTDEGRAMLEIVHDVAPGSSLAFHTAFLGEADFAQGIQDLADKGCQVIADDALYFDEPFFQDGIIAQSVDESKKKGVTYFSAAGNQGVNSYEYSFQPSDVEFLGPGAGTAHNFSAPGDPPVYAQPVYIPPGGSLISSFQWDESSYSASGVGSTSDLDIYLLDINGNIVAAGASDNIASGDPIEVFGYNNDTQSPTFFIVILKFAGPDPGHIKYVLFNDALFYSTIPAIPGVLTGTCYGHPKAAGAIATGATYYQQTPAYGVDTAILEFYSSFGGIPNYFDIEGNRIAPLIRKKPDLIAPDGVNTSFFNPFGYPDGAFDGDSYPNFFGTSAAAPHAAGVAALMIEAQKLNTITPDQIRGVMSSNTSDMDDPLTPGFDKGFDVASGYGLIMADKAVGAVKFPKLYIKNLKLEAACSDDPSTIRNWTVANPNPFEVQVQWFLTGTTQKGSFLAPPGDTDFSTNTLSYRNFKTPNIAIINWEDNFGFTRVDAEFSSTSQCGKDAVSSSKGIAMETYTKENAARGSVAEVYPNPTTDNFKLYLSLDSDEPANVELYTQDGRLLYSNRITQPNGLVSIPASDYSAGVYVIKLKQGTFLKTFKVVKQ
jgi:Subtilase family/Secretion system C-terminal sorting domain